jgi:hypothetical protein
MGVLRLHRCPLLVLDEADQLLGDVYARHINTLMQVNVHTYLCPVCIMYVVMYVVMYV